ncbi:RraA family protein [Variovorax sp. SG517]|uniref:RraA family protein n=1 Tax=Variovorax sp. SG517 TaxID=2587117 RepID=UPI00159E8123|nr:RraA family protein [Variovorax sp. SG517]NVM90559.1 RraA family protein [Variovorax sp. SG517]
MPASDLIIHPAPPLVPSALVDAFRGVVTPHLSDNLARLAGIVGLHRFHGNRKLVGTAVTVKTRPGDNFAIYKAVMDMQPGHVLVVDGGGDLNNALVGELLLQYALQRGCAGFVIDGAIRDSSAFRERDFPCYARGVTHRGPYKNGPGSINVPVTVGGQVVHPGDIVVGDEDGIVSFPAAQASRLLEAARLSAAKEAAIQQEIATGRVAQSWLTAIGL